MQLEYTFFSAFLEINGYVNIFIHSRDSFLSIKLITQESTNTLCFHSVYDIYVWTELKSNQEARNNSVIYVYHKAEVVLTCQWHIWFMTVDISGLKYVCEAECRTAHNILDLISDFITSADSHLNSHDFQTEKPNRCHTGDCHLYCYGIRGVLWSRRARNHRRKVLSLRFWIKCVVREKLGPSNSQCNLSSCRTIVRLR
jgi:hypothetical protein